MSVTRSPRRNESSRRQEDAARALVIQGFVAVVFFAGIAAIVLKLFP